MTNYENIKIRSPLRSEYLKQVKSPNSAPLRWTLQKQKSVIQSAPMNIKKYKSGIRSDQIKIQKIEIRGPLCFVFIGLSDFRFIQLSGPTLIRTTQLTLFGMSTRVEHQKLSQVAADCVLVEFLVFNSAFGRHRHWLILITSYSFIIIVMPFIIWLESDPTFQVVPLSSESVDDEWHDDDDDEWVWYDRY